MEKIGEIIKKTVYSKKEDDNHTVNSNNSLTVEEKIDAILEEAQITPEGVALMLAEGLGDRRSLPYYMLLAKEHNPAILLEILHYVKSVSKEKTIQYKPAYYMAILKRKGFKTKFREDNK